ncbi:MAG TPA: outer membrane protein, partial [Xanthobacteraceae bacterium]|nr:outer membrane protein [Xanthobacteraceae bacterium]
MVQRVLLASAVIVLAAAGQPAAAADLGRMPAKAPPIAAPVPVQNWTGLYVGGNAGYSWGRTDVDYNLGGFPTFSTTLDPNSFIGGGQIGYNWQLGTMVLGIEGDLAWRHGTDSATFTSGNAFGDFASFSTEQNWVGTVRPRVGFATHNWLIYGTGGVAFGGFKHAYAETRPGVVSRAAADSDTKAGWTAGGGVEYAFTNQWSLGVEYLYTDFGSTTLVQPIVGPLPGSTATFDDKSH